jgi:hypothetical protein
MSCTCVYVRVIFYIIILTIYAASQYRLFGHTCLVYVTYGIVPSNVLQLFRGLVFLLDNVADSTIAFTDAVANQLETCLREWLQLYEHLFGSEACTINLHLFSHIIEHRKSFVRLSDIWLFGFERQNFFLKSVSKHVKQTPEKRMLQALQIGGMIRQHNKFMQLNGEWSHAYESSLAGAAFIPRGPAVDLVLDDTCYEDCVRLLELNNSWRCKFVVSRTCKRYKNFHFPKLGDILAARKHATYRYGRATGCSKCSHVVAVLVDADAIEYAEVLDYYEVNVAMNVQEEGTALTHTSESAVYLAYVNWFPVSNGVTAKV